VFAILKPEPLFYNGKEKIDTKCHKPNTLETMIEYTLILVILNRICEMTKNSLEHPKDDTKLNPL
jgi:hypothetical protein